MAFYFIVFVLLLFCTSRISFYVATNKVLYFFHVKCIRNFAPDSHGTKFSCGRRSVGTISRMACGICIILILVENDRKKKHLSAGLRQKLSFRDVQIIYVDITA